MTLRRCVLVVLACLGASCAENASGPTQRGTSDCSTPGQLSYVRDALQDWYYWYRELPDPELEAFASPEEYLEAVRFAALDGSYSYITSKASSDAFYSESQYIGFGFSYKQVSPSELRVTQSFPGGPAAEAGLARGDWLLTINGKAVAALLASGEISSLFGPDEEGVSIEVGWRDLAGVAHAATLAKRKVTIPTVSQTALLEADGARVGYLHFRNFVRPSQSALDEAFTRLRGAGAQELVLDLRYNGGGMVQVAQHLASLIAGAPLVGKVFVSFTHNDKHSKTDSSFSFERAEQALGLTRLVVITTRSTASASEAIVNGLRPYLDVKTVGERSYGKPVGQYEFDFCDKALFPVCFLVTNARGEADFFAGIPADCAAADDLDHDLASPQEASLAEALYVIRHGRCSGVASAARRPTPAAGCRREWRTATAGASCWMPGSGAAAPAYQLRERSPSSVRRSSSGRRRSRSWSPAGTK